MVHIYLPQKIHLQLEAYEHRTGKSHAEVVLDAVEATYATLLLPGGEAVSSARRTVQPNQR